MKTQWVVEVEKLKNPILKNSISRFNLWFSSIHFENYELVKKKKKWKLWFIQEDYFPVILKKKNYSAPFETKVVVLGKKLSESQAIKK